MKIRIEKATTALLILVALLNMMISTLPLAFSSTSMGDVDLFTQKEPYSGRGENVKSDAFGPEERVILYCYVAYGQVPKQDLLVAFEITLPNLASFSLTSSTNSSGIATVNFTIMTPPLEINASDIFGGWFMIANVLIGGVTCHDTLTFDVDRIVKLLSIRTIDENLTYRTSFGKGGDVGVEVILRNKAMITKSSNLALVIKDELNVPVDYLKVDRFDVQSNEKLVFVYFTLNIPRWAYNGNATLAVSAFTASPAEGGVPYCPSISTTFIISPNDPITIIFRDVAIVDIAPSSFIVERGQPLSIHVHVRNEGTNFESFNVNAHIGDIFIGELLVTGLTSYSELFLNFTFDTSSLLPGNYVLSASSPPLEKEVDQSDNNFVGPTIVIKPPESQMIHDVAIVDLNTPDSSVYVGQTVTINVTIINKGTETETFNASAYYSSSLIGTLQVNDLLPGSRLSLTFPWNTTAVNSDFYQLSASASLLNDADTSDNTFVNGYVEVRNIPPPIHDVAIKNITTPSDFIYIGSTTSFDVTVKNDGETAESFNVILYYESNVIDTFYINDLSSGTERTITFQWKLDNVQEGNYTISAYAIPVQGESDTEDNTLIYGKVKVVESPAYYFTGDVFNGFLFFLLILLVLLLSLLLLFRRRRKKHEETFYLGWTAWYYCYDPKGRLSNTDTLQRNMKEAS